MSRVLLTGAGGFIGAHALDVLLERGHEVYAVARRPGRERPGVTWHALDLLAKPAALVTLTEQAHASHLLHLAWHATPGFWAAPENERWIDASLRLLRAFGEAGGRRAVMAGSCAEYKWGAELLQEQATPLRPATLYGACKHATHVASEAVAAQLGVSLAWGRIFFLYGPGEHAERLVGSVARGLLAGEQVSTSEGLQRRDFMHVRDVADALALLLDSGVRGAVNVASGRATAIREIIALVARSAGGIERVRFGALSQRAGDPPAIAGSVERLELEVGFRPAIALEPGIAATVEWWRERP